MTNREKLHLGTICSKLTIFLSLCTEYGFTNRTHITILMKLCADSINILIQNSLLDLYECPYLITLLFHYGRLIAQPPNYFTPLAPKSHPYLHEYSHCEPNQANSRGFGGLGVDM